MLIYIASYPRSGNTWFRNLLFENFGLVSSSFYSGVNEVAYYPTDPEINEHWMQWVNANEELIQSLSSLSDAELLETLDQNETFQQIWIKPVTHQNQESIHQQTCIHKGCYTLLNNPQFRRYLGLKKETYIVKTHHLPFDTYYQNEKIAQVIRHPGPVIRSYAKYLTNHEKGFSKKNLLLGQIKFGDWSQYHTEWMKAAKTLGKNQYVLVRYETMMDDIQSVLQQTEEFLGFPIINTAVKSFLKYKKENPAFYTFGSSEDWQSAFTRIELLLLAFRHGRQMVNLGYEKNRLAPFRYIFH